MSDIVEIKLTPKERELILKYGYPFRNEAQQLEEMANDKRSRKLHISEYYLEQLVGNLSISINEMNERNPVQPPPVMYEINELTEWLELELARARK